MAAPSTSERPSRAHRGDRLVIALVIAIVGAWLISVALGGIEPGAGAVVITQSRDGFYRRDLLSHDVTFTVETPGTGTGADADRGENTVRIEGGQVRVTSSNCANQICVEHVPIDAPGEQIVCLPHGVVIDIARRAEDVARLS